MNNKMNLESRREARKRQKIAQDLCMMHVTASNPRASGASGIPRDLSVTRIQYRMRTRRATCFGWLLVAGCWDLEHKSTVLAIVVALTPTKPSTFVKN